MVMDFQGSHPPVQRRRTRRRYEALALSNLSFWSPLCWIYNATISEATMKLRYRS